jgi:hypothetical protein
MTMEKHPLIGKLVSWVLDHPNHNDGKCYELVGRFVADLGNGLMLVEMVSMDTGEAMPGYYHVVELSALARDYCAEIFDDKAAVKRLVEFEESN